MNGSSGQSNTPVASENSGQHDSTTSARDRAEQEVKEYQLKAAFSEGWGQNVSFMAYIPCFCWDIYIQYIPCYQTLVILGILRKISLWIIKKTLSDVLFSCTNIKL